MVCPRKVVGRARGGRVSSRSVPGPGQASAAGSVAALTVLRVFIRLVSSVSQGPFVFANIPVGGKRCVNKSLLNECGGWGMAFG